jgi:hypothetical protein
MESKAVVVEKEAGRPEHSSELVQCRTAARSYSSLSEITHRNKRARHDRHEAQLKLDYLQSMCDACLASLQAVVCPAAVRVVEYSKDVR